MIWKNPYILWALVIIPILIAGQWWYKRYSVKKREQYFDKTLFKKLYQNLWQTGNRLKMICMYTAICFFIVAAAGPKIGTKVKKIEREGVELLVAFDLSASMKAEDVQPSRLAKAKYEISKLINQLNGDRVGLIVFTGSAFLQVPLTLDYSALQMFLDITKTDQMPNTATDIKSAMKLAAQTFAEEEQKSEVQAAEVMLIISDGEDHGGNYSQALQKLNKRGVTVYTIGVGTRKGGTIPVYNESGQLKGYKKNSQGQVVTTQLMPDVLQKIARKGGGEYYELNNTGSSINGFISDIKQLDQGKFASKQYAEYENQYRWLALIGMGFLLVSILFPSYRNEQETTKK